MENPVFDGQQGLPTEYDYRMYDRIWQRVSPDLTPYPELRNEPADETVMAALDRNMPAVEAENSSGGLGNLPGAELNPCCMGTQAQESLAVLAGFIDEELAESRCFRVLSQRLRQPRARQLLHRLASEKLAAARQLRAAYYLITGTCHIPAITVERMQWQTPCQALRFCYHQEACNGFNYQRAGDETTDPCLQKLFQQLAEQSYFRAEELMTLLGTFLR